MTRQKMQRLADIGGLQGAFPTTPWLAGVLQRPGTPAAVATQYLSPVHETSKLHCGLFNTKQREALPSAMWGVRMKSVSVDHQQTHIPEQKPTRPIL
jgi:hypothetical protein